MTGQPVDLSVVVVTYNSAASVGACLASLDRHLSGLTNEICVVDNASQDGSAALAERLLPRARVITNDRNGGFAAAINRGITATTGRTVLWLNPDAVLRDEGIVSLVSHLDSHPDVGILGPRILDPDGQLQRSARAFPSYDWAVGHRHSLLTRLFPRNPYSTRYLLRELDPTRVQDVDWVSGASLLHRREIAGTLGGLDEQFFMYCEDVDFCLRARRAGWKTQYHPALTVVHQVGASTRRQSARMLVARHRSLWRYYLKHFPRGPFIDPIAWSAIWSRCAFVVAQNVVAKPFRRRT